MQRVRSKLGLGALLLGVSAGVFAGVLGCSDSSTAGNGSGGTSTAGGAGGTSGGSAGAGGGAGTGAGGEAGGAGGAGGAAAGGSAGSGGAGAGNWDGCDEFIPPPDCTIPEGAVLPGELRCTGLYSNWETRTLRCGVKAYAPAHELWADGAGKQRYVWLPPGQKVDVSDPNEFSYPVGTRFWKEFYVGREGNQKLGETRFLTKVQAGWLYTAYVWSEDGATATQRNDGVENLFGTGHTVPSREQCKTCHMGRENFVLGWDFIMLGEGATGVTAKDLASEDWLSGLDPALLDLTIPGDAIEQAALTYLHANCGVSCHNEGLNTTANPSGLYLRLEVGELESVFTTDAAKAINQLPGPNAMFGDLPQPNLEYYDLRPGDPVRSLVLARMKFRGSDTAMPPLGTHVVHQEGVDAVTAWVESMTEDRGYPAPAP
jgi:hypothetical protein